MLATAPALDAADARIIRLPRRATSAAADSTPLADCFERASPRTLAPKEHLFCDGDRASHVYRVEIGHLCLYRTMSDGRRQVIGFCCPGDIIGLGAIGTHAASAQTTTRTIVRCLSTAALADLARSDPQLSLSLYESLAHELLASRELLFTVSQRTAGERLASFLLSLSRRNARRGEKASEIVLAMTRNDIADFLGLTIETVSRTFTRFRTEGLIDLEQCILVTILDPVRLAELAEGSGESHH